MKKLYKAPLIQYFEHRFLEVEPGFSKIKLPKEHAFSDMPAYVRQLDDRHWLFVMLAIDTRPMREDYHFLYGWSSRASIPETGRYQPFGDDLALTWMNDRDVCMLTLDRELGDRDWDFDPVLYTLPHQLEPQPLSRSRAAEVVEAMAAAPVERFIREALPVLQEYERRWSAGVIN